MLDSQELPPKSSSGTINKESLSSFETLSTGSIIRFEPEILAHDKWQEMLDATYKDGLERGLTVTYDGKNLTANKISQGTERSISLPFFPRGLRSIFSRKEENIVSLHTHPMPSKLNHIQTIPLSDKDINVFLGSTVKALVTIDRGGVHMLTRIPYFHSAFDSETDQSLEFTKDAVAKAKANTSLVTEAMQEIAKKLKLLGANYYYSPNLTLSSNGLIELNKL